MDDKLVSFQVIVTLRPAYKEGMIKKLELKKLEDHLWEQLEMISLRSARDSEFHIESITVKRLRGGKRK
jgi:hypothetical protein